jgi:hypothetical protein
MNIAVLIGNDIPVYMAEYPRRQESSVNSPATTEKVVSPMTEQTQK